MATSESVGAASTQPYHIDTSWHSQHLVKLVTADHGAGVGLVKQAA
jgi:hypothetical protein